MLEIIQIITMIVTSIAVGVTWGMFAILKKVSNNIKTSTPIMMFIGTIVWCLGIIMMAYDICK